MIGFLLKFYSDKSQIINKYLFSTISIKNEDSFRCLTHFIQNPYFDIIFFVKAELKDYFYFMVWNQTNSRVYIYASIQSFFYVSKTFNLLLSLSSIIFA